MNIANFCEERYREREQEMARAVDVSEGVCVCLAELERMDQWMDTVSDAHGWSSVIGASSLQKSNLGRASSLLIQTSNLD